ncbi:ABC transporter substrate-binding protein [Azospirillum sp.]|uniref:ABC transporter substrate-binding protein n=1 Tax=Azospirillum sp. TaxID=34012 RepID=UPI003D712FDA
MLTGTGRRMVLAGLMSAGVLAAMPAGAQVPAFPKDPVTINVIDVAGNLALTQKAIENYRKANPNRVARFTFTKAPAPELAGKVKAQQNAGRVDIDLVLTGTDGLAAGIEQGLWQPLLPTYAEKFPNLEASYLPAAAKMQTLAANQGIVVTYYPSGPLLEYAPERVKTPPKSAEELLAYCKANPGKFMYARPANSGPGRTFLMGLPYLLGDKDPKDPVNGWEKTWAYLKELNSCIEYYPSGTTATMKELGEGSRDVIATTTGWDINPRVLGTVPKSAQVGTLKGFHWVADAHYMVVPKGLAPERLAVVLDLMAFLLKPEQQAYAYDEGYFYPGPAVKDVTLAMAPADSQAAIKEYGRPEYEQLIADNPIELPLDAKGLVDAFRLWDERVGAAKTK